METPSDSEDGFNDMPTRPMRIKVLYTFDTDSKVNCLARFSETLQIPVVQIDDNSHVGVISLHKCLQSIVSASPELLTTHATKDFAIYAYDYSEHETPLVGQGMLSSALTSSAADIITGSMITGRVCQNVPAIFSNGVKETLEVKLRLMPVENVAKVEMKSMEIARTSTPATSAGFDPNAWNNSMQSRPLQSVGSLFDFELGTPEEGQALMDQLLGLGTDGSEHDLQDVGVAETPIDTMFSAHPAFASHSHSAPGSRVGSPNLAPDYGSRSRQIRHQSFSVNTAPTQSRPGSRASIRSEYQQPQHSLDATSPNYEEFQDEDGQARKRAKITQTDWRGKSSFGGRTADLRVTAATAASMQMHRPVATRPFAAGNSLEPPPRVPTPVPRGNTGPSRRGRPSMGSRSLLRQASTFTSDVMSDNDQMSDAIASSPEDESPGTSTHGTPLDIPSSPPIFPAMMQPHADSGYMSERNMYSMQSESCSPEFQDMPQTFIKREESSMSELPQQFADQRSYAPPAQSQMSSRANSPLPNIAPAQSKGARLNNSARRSSLALPTLARPDVSEARAQLQRSRSHFESEAGSPAPSESGRPTGPRRSGSGAPRRKIIEQRLHNAVAKGEMPQYCSHCGAIETPTWRRLYVKHCEGKPSALDYVEGEGETIGIEELEYDDETGEVTKFVIRKSMKKTKDMQPGKGFEDKQICNSCGLWFVKMRSMRPQSKWGRKSGTRKSRKNKAAGEMTDGIEPTSEAFYTDAIGPEDEALQLDHIDSNTSQESSNVAKSSIESQVPRRLSDGMRQAHRSETALERMARSSPVKNDGTQESPIELDDRTPKPTRRLLFPSPRQEGIVKTLDSGDISRPITPKKSFDEKVPQDETNVSVYRAALDKENMPPLDESLAHLFTDGQFKTPQKTPRRSPRNHQLLESPSMVSPSASRKRKAAHVPNAQPKPSHDFMTSPASSRYFLRSTPTRLGATPGQHGSRSGSGSHNVSPFSRQLAEMLANDNPMVLNTPSQAFAFSDLPNFTSPGGQNINWDELDADFTGLDSQDFMV